MICSIPLHIVVFLNTLSVLVCMLLLVVGLIVGDSEELATDDSL